MLLFTAHSSNILSSYSVHLYQVCPRVKTKQKISFDVFKIARGQCGFLCQFKSFFCERLHSTACSYRRK